MRRGDFIKSLMVLSGTAFSMKGAGSSFTDNEKNEILSFSDGNKELVADLVITGGGLGGCACALSALRKGLRVVMTEETDWIGGQLTQQGLSCPDEHPWIEQFGATRTYRELRNSIRNYYFRFYPLTTAERNNKYLNPGSGIVSRLCHEPRVSLAVLYELFAPYLSSGKLILLLKHKVAEADVSGDSVRSVRVINLISGEKKLLTAPYFVDATELGDLLPIAGVEYVTGAESRNETKELHAPLVANPANQQVFTLCFALDYVQGVNNIIDKPAEYDFWRNFVPQLNPAWPGNLLDFKYSNPGDLKPKSLAFEPNGKVFNDRMNLWNYRRIINPENFEPGIYKGGITIVNWPQNDFLLGNFVDVKEEDYKKAINRAEQLNLSLLYWLQTEAPRPDGGVGWSGLRLRGDTMDTGNGMAKYPYIRESRRIKALFTILEEYVGEENRRLATGLKEVKKAAPFFDSVGVGSYHIDLHPTSGGDNYIDFNSLPFQIPLGALLPRRVKNLLPANKNIGTTHITNGCYRLHPVEWNIGESVGFLVAYSLLKKYTPHQIYNDRQILNEFQDFIISNGVEIRWPENM